MLASCLILLYYRSVHWVNVFHPDGGSLFSFMVCSSYAPTHGRSIMPPTVTLQDETLHLQLLKELEQAPHQSQRTLSGALGISLGKLNFCMRALVMKGWVKVGNFQRNPDKRRYAYLLTSEGIEAKARLTASFLQRKMAEYDQLGKEIEELRQELQVERDTDRKY